MTSTCPNSAEVMDGLTLNIQSFHPPLTIQKLLLHSLCPLHPQHLVDDPRVQSALEFDKNDIKVETLFNVSALETRLIASHRPNRGLVNSVFWRLRNGFCPLDEREWDFEKDGLMNNYPADVMDLGVIQNFFGTRSWQ